MTKRHTKHSDGKYHINGKTFELLVGSRAQVYHGTAYKTSSGAAKPKGDALTKKNLKMNKHGRIVSAAKSAKGPQMLKRLHAKGYFTRKGKFGFVRKTAKGKGSRHHKKHHKKHRRTRRGRRRTGVKRVTIHEKRNRRTGRFTKGGRRR